MLFASDIVQSLFEYTPNITHYARDVSIVFAVYCSHTFISDIQGE